MSDIEDQLRAMAKAALRRQRAEARRKARARPGTKQERAREASRRQWSRIKANRDALRAATEAAFPKPKVDKAIVGRVHRDGDARTIHDRHGRLWTIVVDKRGWTAYGPKGTTEDGHGFQAICRTGDASEMRAKMKAMPKALGRFNQFEGGPRASKREWVRPLKD